MRKNFVEITSTDNEGNPKTVFVKRPNPEQVSHAVFYAGKMYNIAIQQKTSTRSQLKSYLEEQGVWDDKKEQRVKDLTLEIVECEKILANKVDKNGLLKTLDPKGEYHLKSGRLTKKDARTLALAIARKRREQIDLALVMNHGDSLTAEGISEQAKFDYFASVCILDESENKVFEDVDNYKELADQEHPYITEAASALAQIIYDYDPNGDLNRAENKVLMKLGFMNEDGKLINEDGKLCDPDGRLVNEDGKFVDEDGNLVDINGNRVDEDGCQLGDGEFDDYLDD